MVLLKRESLRFLSVSFYFASREKNESERYISKREEERAPRERGRKREPAFSELLFELSLLQSLSERERERTHVLPLVFWSCFAAHVLRVSETFIELRVVRD